MRTSVSKLALGVLLVACHDAASPTSKLPPLAIVAGSGTTDTVLAKLSQPLIVEVRDSQGRELALVLVRFTSVLATNPTDRPAMIARPGGKVFDTVLADSTDAFGRARALVQLGTVAGPDRIVIEVPEFGLQDTARYTVLPGAASSLTISIPDTAIMPGAQYSLSATAADRWGNKRPNDAMTFTSRSDVATVDATGKVSAVQVGRGTIVVQTGTARDSAQVSIVPEGNLAVWSNGQLFTVNTDGSALKMLTTTGVASPPSPLLFAQWSPDGSKVLISETGLKSDGTSDWRLSTVNMTGARTLVVGPNASLSTASDARFTRDGSWIYFSGTPANEYDGLTYRIRPDGTQLEQVGPFPSEGGSYHADVSPDGATEVFETRTGAGQQTMFVLGFMDIATHTIKSLASRGVFPRYSPDGSQIAYLAPTDVDYFGPRQLYLMKADGTSFRNYNVSYQDRSGVDWSPDGKFLVVANNRLELVRVSDGLLLPLRVTGRQASWKP